MKYEVDATLMITVQVRVTDHHNEVRQDGRQSTEEDLQDLVMQKLSKQLVLLDIKGGRTGDDGYIMTIDCESIDDWTTDE